MPRTLSIETRPFTTVKNKHPPPDLKRRSQTAGILTKTHGRITKDLIANDLNRKRAISNWSTRFTSDAKAPRCENTNIFLVQFFGDVSVRFNCDLPVRCLQLLNQGRKTSYPKDLPDKYRFIILFEVVA